MTTDFKNIFNNYFQVTESDLEFCKPFFDLISSSKNSILEEDNHVPRYLYYINKGFVRLFFRDENGEEVTSFIGTPNTFVTSFLEFIHQKKTNQNLECITDCEFYRIERGRLQDLINRNENFKSFSLIIFEQAFALANIRANDMATLTADLRYTKLLEQNPEIIQNVPIQYIASFLGIKPQSLSRIRKKLIK
jgi:CRP-like cAMP-binding protein